MLRKKFKREILIIVIVLVGSLVAGCNYTAKDLLNKIQNKKSDVATSNEAQEKKEDKSVEENKNLLEDEKTVDTISNSIMIQGTKIEMMTPNFWIQNTKDSDKIIMSAEEIKKFNDEIAKKIDEVYDLRSYKETLDKKELSDFIKSYKIPEKQMYDGNGKAIKSEFYTALKQNINLEGIKEKNQIKYGMAVKKSNIRSFPTDAGVYDSQNSIEIDRFQETSCEICEVALILHESKDKKWYFIQTYNYRGWVKSDTIAIAKNKDIVFDYDNSKNFIIVTGNHVKTQLNPYDSSLSEKELNMGNRVVIDKEVSKESLHNQSLVNNYAIKIPVRNAKGELEFKTGLISKSEDIHEGYLPYTRANIIVEAFKLQGDRYDWGNKFNGRDCSSFIMSVYKTFGFNLARNADEQEKSMGTSYRFNSGDSIEKRSAVLDKVKAGAAIFMNGHTMMYLGKVDGVHYMIHDFLGYGKKEGAKFVFNPVNEVAVTSTTLTQSSGKPYIESFNSVLQIEQ